MNKTTLYRYFDSEGQLLYVGITGDNTKRQSQHRRNSFWFGLIGSATFEHYDSRDEAFRAEAIAIRTEKPIHNIAMNNTQAEQSIYLDDFRLKLHLMQMFQDKDIDGKQFKPDAAHVEYSRELKSWGANLSDEAIVENLHEIIVDNMLGIRNFPCLNHCDECKKINSTNWFRDTRWGVFFEKLNKHKRQSI